MSAGLQYFVLMVMHDIIPTWCIMQLRYSMASLLASHETTYLYNNIMSLNDLHNYIVIMLAPSKEGRKAVYNFIV